MLLYYITDRTQFPGGETSQRTLLLAKIGEAARAGINYIQLREKDLPAGELERLAIDALRLIQEASVIPGRGQTRLLINSRTDVAIAAGADGVHLRAQDVTADVVRHIWSSCSAASCSAGAPARVTVAASCHTLAEVQDAALQGADFAVFGPVFEKRDTPDARPAGLEALREASRANVPVLALGGVTLENARQCLSAGAAGIAAIRLFQEHEVAQVVTRLRAS